MTHAGLSTGPIWSDQFRPVPVPGLEKTLPVASLIIRVVGCYNHNAGQKQKLPSEFRDIKMTEK